MRVPSPSVTTPDPADARPVPDADDLRLLAEIINNGSIGLPQAAWNARMSQAEAAARFVTMAERGLPLRLVAEGDRQLLWRIAQAGPATSGVPIAPAAVPVSAPVPVVAPVPLPVEPPPLESQPVQQIPVGSVCRSADRPRRRTCCRPRPQCRPTSRPLPALFRSASRLSEHLRWSPSREPAEPEPEPEARSRRPNPNRSCARTQPAPEPQPPTRPEPEPQPHRVQLGSHSPDADLRAVDAVRSPVCSVSTWM